MQTPCPKSGVGGACYFLGHETKAELGPFPRFFLQGAQKANFSMVDLLKGCANSGRKMHPEELRKFSMRHINSPPLDEASSCIGLRVMGTGHCNCTQQHSFQLNSRKPQIPRQWSGLKYVKHFNQLEIQCREEDVCDRGLKHLALLSYFSQKLVLVQCGLRSQS